jgi:hypothetical protein
MFPLLQSVVERGGVDPAALTQDLYAAFKAYPGRLNQAYKDLVPNVGQCQHALSRAAYCWDDQSGLPA